MKQLKIEDLNRKEKEYFEMKLNWYKNICQVERSKDEMRELALHDAKFKFDDAYRAEVVAEDKAKQEAVRLEYIKNFGFAPRGRY